MGVWALRITRLALELTLVSRRLFYLCGITNFNLSELDVTYSVSFVSEVNTHIGFLLYAAASPMTVTIVCQIVAYMLNTAAALRIDGPTLCGTSTSNSGSHTGLYFRHSSMPCLEPFT
jgi:hypothetical protein